jgi:hypothetical protein
MGRDKEGVENKTFKFYVSSRDVRIVCPRLEGPCEVHGYAELLDSAVAVLCRAEHSCSYGLWLFIE